MALQKPQRLVASKKLSIAAGPYEVHLASGKIKYCIHLGEIRKTFARRSIMFVFDRHAKASLDLRVLYSSCRRKYIKSKT